MKMELSDDALQTTINGRPVLTPELVQAWIRTACGRVPLLDNATQLASKINYFDFLSPLWIDTAEYKKWRAKNPSKLRLARIAQALAALQSDLPVEVANVRKEFPDANGPNLLDIIDLLAIVDRLAPTFEPYRPRGGGRNKAGWHSVARALAPLVVSALESSGVMKAGFGQPTAPAVVVLRSALEHLRVNVTEDAIVDAMRNRTKLGKLGLRNP